VRRPAEVLADAVREQLGGFTPENVGELDVFFEDLRPVFSELSEKMDALATNLEEHNWIGRDTADHLHRVANNCMAAAGDADSAQETYATGPVRFWRR
jgi:hypothetical protein